MTSNILLINQGRILAEGDVHQIRDLIDEHPHTVHIKAEQPRALAREFLARRRCAQPAVRGGRGRRADRPARRVLRAAHGLAASGELGADPRSHLARRQPAGRFPVPGEVMATHRPRSAADVARRSRRCASSICRSGRCSGRAARSSSALLRRRPRGARLAAARLDARRAPRVGSASTARRSAAPRSSA